MSLEEWLKKNNPDDGPKYYSFNYEKYKRDTVNEQKKHKEFFVTKMEKIVETTILDEFQKLEGSFENYFPYGRESVCLDLREYDVVGNHKYVVDDIFVKNLIEKIKYRM